MPVGNQSDQLEQQLIASGAITDSMSIEQIAEIVGNAETGTPAPAAPPVEAPAPVVTETPAEQRQPLEQTPPAAAAAPATPAPVVTEPEGPVTTPSGQQIPYSVLRNTRAERDDLRAENLRVTAALNELQERHRAETERLNQLIQGQGGAATPAQVQQAQQIANRAGLRDQNGNPVDVASVDLSQFEGQYPTEILTLLGALQARVIDLAETDAQRRTREQQETRTQEQIDIDSVPLIAEWHSAQDPTMWNAAAAAYSSLKTQAQWAGKSRVEVLTEVANRLGGPRSTVSTPAPTPTATPGTKTVAAQIAQARAASVPLSHSDLPAGHAPAQGEAEQLANLDITQLAERMGNMTPEAEAAMLARYG